MWPRALINGGRDTIQRRTKACPMKQNLELNIEGGGGVRWACLIGQRGCVLGVCVWFEGMSRDLLGLSSHPEWIQSVLYLWLCLSLLSVSDYHICLSIVKTEMFVKEGTVWI